MEGAILAILCEMLSQAILQYTQWEIKRKLDNAGKAISEFYALFDDDGDGQTDREELVFSFDVSVPQNYSGFSIVNSGDEIGLGYPEYEIIDSNEFSSRISNRNDGTITTTDNYYIIDDDVYLPIPLDYNGDGQLDWGRVLDENHDGVPDASPSGPFYPVGSDDFNRIIETTKKESGEKSFIIVSAEGTVSVYDPNGDLTEEDYDKAYTLWLKDNAALEKPFKHYSVTEALLLIVAIFAGVSLVGKLFKRRVY